MNAGPYLAPSDVEIDEWLKHDDLVLRAAVVVEIIRAKTEIGLNIIIVFSIL